MISLKTITAISSLVVINSLLLGVTSKLSLAQSNSPESNLSPPLDVKMPENKQDFVQQCVSNLEANNTNSAEAEAYCSCSADAAYNYISKENNISSDAEVLEAILQCRVNNITNEE